MVAVLLCVSIWLVFSLPCFRVTNGAPADSILASKRVFAEPPPFLLKMYDDLNNGAGDKTISLDSCQAEHDAKTGEFYFSAWPFARSENVPKAEIYLSTHPLVDFSRNKTLTLSVVEASKRKDSSRLLLPSPRLFAAGWLTFPVTLVVNRWMAEPDQPLRIRILVEDNDEDESMTTPTHWSHSTPWLVIYSDVGNSRPLSRFPFGVRDGGKMNGSSSERPKRQINPEAKLRKAVGCRKTDMIINTTAVGWSGWLIKPNTFNAYQCEGKCSKSIQNFVNHAFLKALVHQQLDDAADFKPCCVPTKMKPIPFLYYKEPHRIVLHSFNDMVVEECGCY